jgi:histidinol-phosphate aminotransferase
VNEGLRFRPEVLAATPYVPEWDGLDRAEYTRLDRNESTAPISDNVSAALIDHVRTRGIHSYPTSDRLITSLAGYSGVPADSIVPTNGSDQAIDLCLRAFLGPGDRLLVARPEFSVFSHIAELIGAVVEGVPYRDDLEFPYKEIWSAAERQPDLIVFINPNNPTGSGVDVDFIKRVAVTFPNIPVIVDEAYYEFTGVTVADLVSSVPNLIVLRTFSKAFAMAGLRLGYVIARPEVATEIYKLRNPFDVNELAVVAALAQLDNMAEVEQHVADIMKRIKPMMVDFFALHNVFVHPGLANFILVREPRCTEAVDYLRSSGILVRSMKAPALAGSFRMSMGTVTEMRDFILVYEKYLSGRQADDRQGAS